MSEKKPRRDKIKSAITSTTEQCRRQDRLTSDRLCKLSTLFRSFDHTFAAEKARCHNFIYAQYFSSASPSLKFDISKIQQFRIIIK